MMSTAERLVYMANQIARNFEALGHDHAVAATADHIAAFWDPSMRAAIMTRADAELTPTARAAIERLRTGRVPEPQTRATEFNASGETGGSDAG
jgi:formate dehydrogenase subunit delta